MTRMIETMSKDELELLTPAERASLEGESDDDGDKKPMRLIDEADVPPPDGTEGANDRPPSNKGFADRVVDTRLDATEPLAGETTDDDDEEDDEPTKAAPAKPAGEEPGETPPAVEEPELEVESEITAIDLMPVRAVPEKKDWDALGEAVAKQYDEGEIDTAAYSRQIRALTIEQAKYDDAVQYNAELETARAQQWDRQQDAFFKAHKEYSDNPVLGGALNQAVITLAANPKHAEKSGDAILKLAHAEVQKVLRVPGAEETPPATPAKPAAAAPAAPAKPAATVTPIKSRKPDLQGLPATLAHLPAAAAEETGDDRFAAVDKLPTMERELAIRRMTPEQEEQYLRGTG